MENPQTNIYVLLLLYHVCITPSLKLSSSQLGGSHGTTAVAPSSSSSGGYLFTVHLCVRICVCAMFTVDLGKKNERIISREAQ